MPRKARLFAAIFALSAIQPSSIAQANDWYTAIRGSFVTDADGGFGGGLGVAIGRQWRSPAVYNSDIRAEFELAYRRNDTAIGYIDSLTEMVNIILDFKTPGRKVIPYLGAGLGGMTAGNGDDIDQTAAYQGMAGMKFRVGQGTWLGGEYRYLAAPGLTLDNRALDYNSHSVLVGIAFTW